MVALFAPAWGCGRSLACLAACLAVYFATATLTASAADKPFQNDDLANSAIELEAQIKSDAGAATKPVAQLRRDADAAFAKNDFRTGMAVLGQIVAAAPNDATTWLRLARTIQQIRPADDRRAQPCCSSAPRPPPISPISAPPTETRRPTAWRSSARC